METVVFVCVYAPALAQSAARRFNELADGERVRALTAADVAAPENVRLVVTLGTATKHSVRGDEREQWPMHEPRGMIPGHEKMYLALLRKHVSELVKQRGWLRQGGVQGATTLVV